MKRKIDHIVYTVSNLEEAITEFENKLGVRPVLGGYHKTFGTKNALINLNDSIYLELLAADDSNTEIVKPRWMGVDQLTKNQITRWALRSDSLKPDAKILRTYNPHMGEIRRGSRNAADGSLLQWELIMPLPAPEVEILPFILDWSATEKHPSELLPKMACELLAFYGTHPKPEMFEGVFQTLNYSIDIRPATEVSLKALIKSPKGIVSI